MINFSYLVLTIDKILSFKTPWQLVLFKTMQADFQKHYNLVFLFQVLEFSTEAILIPLFQI